MINKTLVYGSLAAFITAVYVAIVVGLGALVAQHGARVELLALSIAATAVVAVAFQPVRARVQHLANRLVYGKRATPYEVLAQFAGRTAGTYATEELLPAHGADPGRGHRRLPGGRMAPGRRGVPGRCHVAARRAAVRRGQRGPPAGELAGSREPTGFCRCGTRTRCSARCRCASGPGESLTPAEGKLLADLAAQAGLVLRNVGLWEQLTARLEEIRASRQRLVAAQDEERRRIERNIHDGAQQQLVALTIKLNLTEDLIGTDPEGERELLAELRREAAAAVEDLRDLARGIYPPLLAGEGLAAALRAQASQGRRSRRPSTPSASADTRRTWRPRSTSASSRHCRTWPSTREPARPSVRLAASGDELRFEVADDGAGFDPGTKALGTGLQGMADRLSAHDGALDVRTAPGTGTVVAGRLRVRVPEAAR